MCPFCISTLGLIVAGAVSTGGLATLALKVSRQQHDPENIVTNSNEGSNQDVH